MSLTTDRPVVVTRGAVPGDPGREGFGSLAEAIDAVAAVDALLASLAASRAVLMSELGEWAAAHVEEIAGEAAEPVDGTDPEVRSAAAGVVAERLAEVLRVTPDGAAALVEESRALVHRHPRTLAALRSGRITYGHAQTILGYTCGLRRGGRTALETRLLRHARTLTVGELSRVARVERERRLRQSRAEGGRRASGAGAGRQRPQMSSQAGGAPACM